MNKILEKINAQPWYFEKALCDDCLGHGDRTKKQVKRIEDDGLCFCQKHWDNYKKSMAEAGFVVEPFFKQ